MSASEILGKIAEKNQIQLSDVSSLSGGDINEVFLITTTSAEKFVVKMNFADKFPGMFTAEKAGLETLGKTKDIDIPKVIALGEANPYAYLMLEYKAFGEKKTDFWELFGQQMAALHKNTAGDFGFSRDNYIGSLPQYNSSRSTAADFYISQRLEPQIKMAKERGYKFQDIPVFLKNVSEIIPDEEPALIHGDLWNGNYLVNSQGNPCLIDPAVAFAPREMDLAMMKLFGGFSEKLFVAYKERFPLIDGFEERIPLWQLYYLLVHLNLFGAGYKASVTTILKRFS